MSNALEAALNPTSASHPFLKWVGGKRGLLDELLPRVPTTFSRYWEPFLGGGALFFSLQPKSAVLNDLNPRLVRTYKAVRDNVDELVALLRQIETEHRAIAAVPGAQRAFYDQLRAVNPDTGADAALAAWMIYTNRVCFNGVYRVNKAGIFNVPFGRNKNPTICDEENLRACGAALRTATLYSGCDALEVSRLARPGDLVYFDPPYAPVSKTADFTGYTSNGFGPAQQAALRDCALELKRRGVHVMLSNADVPAVRDLYSMDFLVERVEAPRAVNSKARKRGPVGELIIR